MMLADDLLRGLIQVKDRASLSHPALKLLLVAAALIFSVLQFTVFKAYETAAPTIAQQCLISLTLIVAASVDLRHFGRPRFVRRALLFTILLLGVAFAQKGNIFFIEVIWNKFLGVWSMAPLLRKVEGTTWLGIANMYAAYLAMSNLSTRDFVWLGRRIILPTWRPMYQVFVVTIAVLSSAAPRIGAEVYWIARVRSRLLQNPSCDATQKGYRLLFFKIMGNALLYRFTYVAQVIERLLEDRGYFVESYADPIERTFSDSDVFACVLIGGGFVAYLLFGA